MNKRIRTLAIGLMVCYVALFISLQIPQMFKSKSLNANPSNTRQVEQGFDKPRGDRRMSAARHTWPGTNSCLISSGATRQATSISRGTPGVIDSRTRAAKRTLSD